MIVNELLHALPVHDSREKTWGCISEVLKTWVAQLSVCLYNNKWIRKYVLWGGLALEMWPVEVGIWPKWYNFRYI